MDKKTFISGSALLMLGAILFISATKDDKKNGFDARALEKSMKYIPMGSYMFEDSSWESQGKIKGQMISLSAFYMCNHTVTNKEYGIFLTDLKDSNKQLYSKMLPDTLVWITKKVFMEDMIKYYFSHPSFRDYPVVGVSHEQAEYYCKWLTAKYMKDPKRNINAKVVFKLPNLYQWEWAVHGGHAPDPFPWPGQYVRNYKGMYLANFIHMSECGFKRENDTGKVEFAYSNWQDGSGTNLNDAADITAPAISYWPNDYGLYNMAGNVAEYVSEVGITKGGDWNDPGYYIQIWAQNHYKNAQSASDKVGFRVCMKVEN